MSESQDVVSVSEILGLFEELTPDQRTKFYQSGLLTDMLAVVKCDKLPRRGDLRRALGIKLPFLAVKRTIRVDRTTSLDTLLEGIEFLGGIWHPQDRKERTGWLHQFDQAGPKEVEVTVVDLGFPTSLDETRDELKLLKLRPFGGPRELIAFAKQHEGDVLREDNDNPLRPFVITKVFPWGREGEVGCLRLHVTNSVHHYGDDPLLTFHAFPTVSVMSPDPTYRIYRQVLAVPE